MADFGDGIGLGGGGIDIDGEGISGGGGSGFGSGLHLTFTAQLFIEAMRRGEVQTWEGGQSAILSGFKSLKVGAPATNYKFITAANGDWGTPFVGGVQAPRRHGKVWTMQVTVVQLRKCVLWTLDFAEVQKNIKTWMQNIPVTEDQSDYSSPDLSQIAQWERAKDIQDWDDYDNFKTVDGDELTGRTRDLAEMIYKGIDSYTIHTPVPTMSMRYFDEVEGTGVLLDKYLQALPTGPQGWEELGGANIHGQLDKLKEVQMSGGTIVYKWLCISDKATPNGDGSCTRTIQFMRVDEVEQNLYTLGTAAEGGLA